MRGEAPASRGAPWGTGLEGAAHLRQLPLLVGGHPRGLPPVLALAQLGQPRAGPQAQLLADVVPQVPLRRVLKILRGARAG